MTTLPNYDKIVRTDISGLKIMIKPHVFLMVYYYFLNAFPIYDIDSIDKPNFFSNDPEDNPKMSSTIIIDDSLLCF